MSDKDMILQRIGGMEGQVVTKQLAQTARDLAGYPVGSPELELMKGQMLILMLRDLGGKKTYSVEEIDNAPRDYVLTLQLAKGNNKALEFALQRKPGRG